MFKVQNVLLLNFLFQDEIKAGCKQKEKAKKMPTNAHK